MLNENEIDSKEAMSWARGESSIQATSSSSGDFSQEMGKAIEETLRMLEAQ